MYAHSMSSRKCPIENLHVIADISIELRFAIASRLSFHQLSTNSPRSVDTHLDEPFPPSSPLFSDQIQPN